MEKKTKKARWSLAGHSKTQLIEMVKVLFFALCMYAFFIGFLIGVMTA
jgi:hypothetical protein